MSLIRINRNPSGRQLLTFAGAWVLALGAAGLGCWLRGRRGAAEAIWALGAAVPLCGLADRRALRAAFLGLSYLTYPVGYAVSHAVLAAAYYAVLTPIGLTMRLLGHDPLSRGFDPARGTYWTERKGPRPPESYFKQE
jgi:hypothetical protein